ncbi:MAG: GTPase HflX [Candidatus Anammoxibacter sp.]
MIEPKRIELSVNTERAILIRAILTREQDCADPFLELEKLAKTAGAKVVNSVIQKKSKIDPVSYFGKGKAKELAVLCSQSKADVIICDHDLNPSQIKNLESITETKVIDRSELILDIFATHAKSKQARLQVELAQKEYMLPRLKHLWNHLERIEGGIGTRGPGEKQLEIDRRLASKKIVDLKKKISKIEKAKKQQLNSRRNFIKISLVGYTNTGKSTLMNALTGAGVPVEDKFFATLDTKTKDLNLIKGRKVLLSDTVGFIRKLPHHLVSSFNATLDETIHADLLIHVVDISSTYFMEQVSSVNKVLKKLGCLEKPTLMALNKTDAVNDLSGVTMLKKRYKHCVAISAVTGSGLDELKNLIIAYLDEEYIEVEVICENKYSKLIANIFANTTVLNTSYEGDRIHLNLMAGTAQLKKLNKLRQDTSNANMEIITKSS